jgi:hypothetical protein
MVIDGVDRATINVSEATTAQTSRSALYGIAGGNLNGLIPPRESLPASVQSAGSPFWRFVGDATLMDVGSTGANDYIVVLQVTQAVCVALNDIVFGRGVYSASTIPVMATTAPTVTIAQVATGGTGVIDAGNEFDFGTGFTPALAGRIAACVRPSTAVSTFYFYQLLAAG